MKRVIKGINPKTVVCIDQWDRTKLYFCKTNSGLYKLHCVDHKWGFINLLSIMGASTGWQEDVLKAFKFQIEVGDVFEFDNLKEAMEELL